VTGEPREIRASEPTSLCVMEMFDKATFAQVPLELTGDPARPVQVAATANGDSRVGVSPLWRLGKKAIGRYLPVQFRAGRPRRPRLAGHASRAHRDVASAGYR
jgi:sulfide:quinone oxidoreductase